MEGWNTDIVRDRKPKRDRSSKVNICDSFLNNFKDKKASDDNISSFLEEQQSTLRKLMSTEAIVGQFMEIIKQVKDDDELMNCCEKAMSQYLSKFFSLKPKKEKAMFFPCRSNEDVLTGMIYDSKKSLDICVFSITNDHIANAIYVSSQRGVKVRIITDDECMKQKGSDVLDLAHSGIPVRTDNDERSHMHNKFAVVDDKYLINGSFNWTTQAVNYNQENILIIENKTLVKEYQNEFNRLWNQFSHYTVDVSQVTPHRFKKLRR